MVSIDLKYSRKKYLESSDGTELHTVDIWEPVSKTADGQDEKLWLIYIHGGAWRDPAVDSQSFYPAVKEISKSSIRDKIAGFASINYRLSPYPTHSDNPSSSDDLSRNAHYPDHIRDVGDALFFLQKEYRIGGRYVLIGHSAGATMALELHKFYFTSYDLPLPAAILGVSGIYNFEGFVQAHSEIPAYRELMENAFPDLDQWDRAAPYTSRLHGQAVWEQVQTVVISHSDEDELVEKEQASSMLQRIQSIPSSKQKVYFLKATGNHDEIWESGTILADLVIKTVEIIKAP